MRDKTPFLLLLFVVGAVFLQGAQDTATVSTPEGEIRVEVADTPRERRVGLMNRSSVPRDGMLFIYEKPSELVFWMKDTRIPLDIVFISGTGEVLNVAQAEPEPGVPPERLTRYRSDGAALYALELPQGRAEELGLTPGSRVDIVN